MKNCEVEVRILVKRNAFHDFHSERHSNLCGKLVNFRTLCNCYIIPIFLTALKMIIYLIEREEISSMDVFSQFGKLHAKLATSYQFPHSKNAMQPKALMKN